MTALIFDRVWETTTTTGTGSYTLAGAKSGNYKAFGDVLSNSEYVEYFVRNADGDIWERVWGQFNSGTQALTRNLIESSTGSLIDWGSGTKEVYIAPPAASLNDDRGILVAASRPAWVRANTLWIDSDASPVTLYVYDGTGDEILGTYTTSGFVPYRLGTAMGAAVEQGLHTIWIPAGAMEPTLTNGATPAKIEMSSNKNIFKTLNFATGTQQFAQFEVFFPKSWDLGTVTFQPQWSHAATSSLFGVVFGLAGVARSDSDPGDVAFGTAQTSTDTGGTTNDIYLGPTSSAITIAGTPAAGDTVQFQINRTVADGSDNLGVDARLHGIRLFYTVSAATDA